jgi:hypothetical protein
MVAVILAATGGAIAPIVFGAILAAAVLGQLLFEAATPRSGARTPWTPTVDIPSAPPVVDLAANVRA